MRWWVAMLSLCGCAEPLENAILELDVALPPNTTVVEPLYAVVQAEPGAPDFFAPWDGEPAAFALARMQIGARLSLVSEVAHAAIAVKIRYCEDARCAVAADERAPEVHIRIARPFHLREYSAIALDLREIPPAFETIDIGACEVRACTADERATYCDARGVHVCDL